MWPQCSSKGYCSKLLTAAAAVCDASWLLCCLHREYLMNLPAKLGQCDSTILATVLQYRHVHCRKCS